MSTIVLVGGSFMGAAAWGRVTPRLRELGHDVYPLSLTGFGDRRHLATPQTNLTTHATDIVAAVTELDLRDVVLVGHSYGGAPATVAAQRIPERIARLVYVTGVIPEPGKTLFETAGPAVEELVMRTVTDRGFGWLIPVYGPEIRDVYFGDHGLSAEDVAWLEARSAPQPVATDQEPAPRDLSAVETLPRTYVVCTGDPGEGLIQPGTPGFDVVRLDAGHWPMVSKPAELATVIDDAAGG